MVGHCAWRILSQNREDITLKMFILLLPGFIAALSVFLSSQMSPVTALPVQITTSSRLENMDSLSVASNIFVLKLFKTLSANYTSQNLVFSPLSISSSLLMIFLGARNNTAAQMSQVLSVLNDGEVHERFEKLISDINRPSTNYSLSLVNQLFGETSYDFLAPFIDSIQRFYHAGLGKLNFTQASEESRRHINAWVEEKTSGFLKKTFKGEIQDLLVPGTIDSLTKLVLVNVIYFKGNWANKFNKGHTEEKPFWINKKERKTVQMMSRKGKYNMAHISAYQVSILELPYGDSDLSMIILLPDEIEDNSTGLEKLEREITYEKLMDWINPVKMFPREIELSFPKFKLEEKYDLKPVLKCMGMTDAFDEGKADFSGMSANNDLVISEIVHKSFIEVNEEGTEAAAAAGIIAVFASASLPFRVKVDHPFLFLIRQQSTKSTLFFERKIVQMMSRKGKYNMAHILAYQISFLEIPYDDSDFSMIILFPDEIEDNSTGFEKREIKYEKLMDWINPEKMDPREIELSLPKFKLKEKYDLKLVLRSMGMMDAFDEGKADFSGMSTKNDIIISEVVHKSFIEVNKEGTEAAAAIAVIGIFKNANVAVKFNADHPFVFFVIDKSGKNILFSGRYCSP